ncbi:hypothetical protein [Pseudomonas yamanorum]|jgi:hypothetical protein|uniref:hypothetical protein n=1 Tax=Pseudomonas yamanorum TaxID=515393 RepID=UPI003B9FEC3C
MPTKKAKTSEAKPKFLDQLFIPGMSPGVENYAGGIPLRLLTHGLTVIVYKNWSAKPNDKIQVVSMPGLNVLAEKTLMPGEEADNSFAFAIPDRSLPEGGVTLGYVVHYEGGPDSDTSNPLHVLVKRTVPAGDDKNLIAPGHSELNFKPNYLEIRDFQANLVTVTVDPYPNMDGGDLIALRIGNYDAPRQQVSGVGKQTVISLPRDGIVEAGNGTNRPVSFNVVDLVGNVSWPRSRNISVLIDLDRNTLRAPIIKSDDVAGFIDLERLNGQPLHIELFLYFNEGPAGHTYFVTYRGYPKLGGIVREDKYITIEEPGRAVDFFVPNEKVRACAGGRVEISYELLKSGLPTRYSKFTTAQVVDAIVRLQAPFFLNHTNHVINPIPKDGGAVEIPWYAWRNPTDKIELILRHVLPGSNQVTLYTDRFTVGNVPEGIPIRRLIPYKELLRFDRLTPELYYVYEPEQYLNATADIPESDRQVVQIGPPAAEV